MIKLIATDLDGTLLTPSGEISTRNKQAILAAQEAGIEVIVATGRSLESALRPFMKTDLALPMICVNGAESYSAKYKLLNAIPMNKKIIDEIITVSEENHVFLEIYTNKGIFIKKQTHFVNLLTEKIKAKHSEITQEELEKQVHLRFQDEIFIHSDSLQTTLSDPEIYVLKALAFSFDTDQLIKTQRAFDHRTDLVVTSSGSDNIEFNHPDAQKGFALKAYADNQGISLEHVMAIGDNLNDLSMLQVAGRGIAMENAVEQLKKEADQVTSSNDQDGVAIAIEAILP